MERATNALYRLATLRNLMLAILLSAVSVSIMGYLTQTLVYGVYGVADMPDTMFWYTINEITEAFNILGPEGLQTWLQVHMLDLIFPIGYSLSLVFGLALVIKAGALMTDKVRNLVWLPIFAAVADYIENGLVASQAVSYPNLSELIISISSLVTAFKWTLLYLAFAMVFILLIVAIYVRKKQ